MSRNSRNGLYSRMERQELSLMGNSMKTSVRPSSSDLGRIQRDIRDDYELKNSFRL